MPRVSRLLKKKKSIRWHGVPVSKIDSQSSSAIRPRTTVTSCKFGRKDVGASKRKLTRHSVEYNQFEDDTCHYDIVDFAVLSKLMLDIAVFKRSGYSLTQTISNRVGLAYKISLECDNDKCDAKISQENSTRATVEGNDRIYYDINLRFVYALRTIGIVQETG